MINNAYFSKIGIEQAYWLGFINADGHITQKNVLMMGVATKDKQHLQKIAEVLGVSTHIKERISYYKEKSYLVHTLSVSSKAIRQDLERAGIIIGAKSWIAKPLFFKDSSLQKAYWRGHFDGDGCAHIDLHDPFGCEQIQISLAGTQEIVRAFAEYVGFPSCVRTKRKKYWYFEKSGSAFAETIYSKLYDSPGELCLQRKKDIISGFLQRRKEKLEMLRESNQRIRDKPTNIYVRNLLHTRPDIKEQRRVYQKRYREAHKIERNDKKRRMRLAKKGVI